MMSILALPAVLWATMQSQQDLKFEKKITKVVSAQFSVTLPKEYSEAPSTKKWPLLLFLHGASERGTDIAQVRVHGPQKEQLAGRSIPMVIVAPQCPPNTFWDTDVLIALLDHVEKKYRIDTDRVYVTGLSMGGYGTWALAAAQPNRFAAIAPICGGGNPVTAKRIAHIPVWAVHGDKDLAVPISESVQMIEALKAAGANPRFDIIEGGGHDVWTEFYAKSEFYEWLLRFARLK
jgi:predicted peptidase